VRSFFICLLQGCCFTGIEWYCLQDQGLLIVGYSGL
jgi:hypothetical protein